MKFSPPSLLRCLGLAFGLAALPAISLAAATPAMGTLSEAGPTTLSFKSSGPVLVSDPGGVCASGCDNFSLTLSALSKPYTVQVTVKADGGLGDFDAQVRRGATVIGSGSNGGDEDFTFTSQSGNDNLTVRIIPFAGAGDTYTATVTILNVGGSSSSSGGSSSSSSSSGGSSSSSSSGGSSSSSSGGAMQDPGAPRYKVHVSPPETGNDAGEPSIGFNPFTHTAMFMNNKTAVRMNFREFDTPNPLPASCDAKWTDKPGTLTQLNTLDPILFTDQKAGPAKARVFNSQLSGANSLFEFSDDDGNTWNPGQVGPPNGGADHQTIAAGPYPTTGAGSLIPHPTYPNAVYYCSQSIATAFCARSDDGGQSFGPGIAFKNPRCSAGALHGHVKVAPNGTVYVPDPSGCVLAVGGANEVLAHVSTDAGNTFTASFVAGATGGGSSDPSIGIATDNTVYMCYEKGPNDGLFMVKSTDNGKTWGTPVSLFAGTKLKIGEFPQAIAGDGNRAACAFIATDAIQPDGGISTDSESLDFKGVWYPYIATTYDGGATYSLVNVSPTDPVQGYGGVGPDGTNRNLLDFNDLQLDDLGRPLYAYADGCIGPCVSDPAANSFASKATVARQSGGRTLFSANDNKAATQFNGPTPIAPAAACASQELSLRTAAQTKVVWNAPDNGGTNITNYQVLRSTVPSGEPFVKVGDAGVKNFFIDNTASPNQAHYYYRIVAQNVKGDAPMSNTLDLPISTAVAVDTCKLPGELVASDATGDGNADDLDFVSISVAEPESMANPDAFKDMLVMTIKMKNFTSGRPAAGFIGVIFASRGDRYVGLDSSNPAALSYEYGNSGLDPAGQTTTFTKVGNLDNRSGFSADGTIVLVIPYKTVFPGLKPGDNLVGFDGRSRAGTSFGTSRDTIGSGAYLLRGTDICKLDTVLPLATLAASTNSGSAPLDVSFTVGGTPHGVKTLVAYSINFGDGTVMNDVPFGGTASVPHRYASPGVYQASLQVKDNKGFVSTNTAVQNIEALAPSGVTAFSFIERVNVPVSSFVTSESVTLAGFSGTLPVSITTANSGQYSINGGAFTNAAGTVKAGDRLAVRHVSSPNSATDTISTVTVGSYSTSFKSTTTTLDRVPDAFSFGTLTGLEPTTQTTSDPVTLKGFNTGTSIVAGPDVEYRIGSGAWTKAAGTLQPVSGGTTASQPLQVRATTNSAHLGYTKVYLKVGGVTGYFTLRTK